MLINGSTDHNTASARSLITVPKLNPLLAERREPSGIEEPESLRSSATTEIGAW